MNSPYMTTPSSSQGARIVGEGLSDTSGPGPELMAAATLTGNTVVNDIQARFVLRDGKICEHHDSFDLWKWSRQALGFKGLLLGWTPLVSNAVRAQALKGLRAFQASR